MVQENDFYENANQPYKANKWGHRNLWRKINGSILRSPKRMGTIIEYPIFYEKLTARETLELHCEYMGYYDKMKLVMYLI